MASLSVYSQVSANKRKSIVIMALFVVVIVTIAYIIGRGTSYGISAALLALFLSILTSLGSYFYSDKLVLSLSGANEADREKDFDLYTVSENMAIASGLPKPKVYIIEDKAPNAFATGRDPSNAVICVTRGLVEKLKRRELEGVIAHELSHIKNYDTRLMAIVAVLVGTIALLSDWSFRFFSFRKGNHEREIRGKVGVVISLFGIAFAIVSPLIATLIQLAISRRREYLADASAVLYTRQPEGLAQALEIISSDKLVLKNASNATAHLFIANPFKNKGTSKWLSSFFDTHPPVEERIKILRQM